MRVGECKNAVRRGEPRRGPKGDERVPPIAGGINKAHAIATHPPYPNPDSFHLRCEGRVEVADAAVPIVFVVTSVLSIISFSSMVYMYTAATLAKRGTSTSWRSGSNTAGTSQSSCIHVPKRSEDATMVKRQGLAFFAGGGHLPLERREAPAEHRDGGQRDAACWRRSL